VSPTSVLGLKLVQSAQSQLDLWWYLGWLFGLLFYFGSRPLCLLLAMAVLSAGFCGLRLLLWSRCAGSTWLVFLLAYDELGVKL
jgi:hypothetical protein